MTTNRTPLTDRTWAKILLKNTLNILIYEKEDPNQFGFFFLNFNITDSKNARIWYLLRIFWFRMFLTNSFFSVNWFSMILWRQSKCLEERMVFVKSHRLHSLEGIFNSWSESALLYSWLFRCFWTCLASCMTSL